MEKSLEIKIQYFADYLLSKVVECESGLLLGKDLEQEKDLMKRAQLFRDVLDDFERVFNGTIFKEESF